MRGERADRPEVAVPLGVVETIPHDEFVFDREADVIDLDVDLAPGRFAEQAGRAELPRGARAQQPKEVKIALVAPLSGPWARQGILLQMGADLAVEDVNSSGGIKALGGAKMKLVVYDTGDSAEKAKNAAQRLVAQEPDVVGGMGSWLSSFTLAVTEVTERAELPWLTLSYSDLITGRGFKYIFQSSPTADAQATAMLPRVVDLAAKAGSGRPTKVAFVGDNSAAAVSFMKPIRGHVAKDLGLTIVADETYTPPLADATTLVQKIRSGRPDFIVFQSTNVGDDKLLLDKFAERGITAGTVPLIGPAADAANAVLRGAVVKHGLRLADLGAVRSVPTRGREAVQLGDVAHAALAKIMVAAIDNPAPSSDPTPPEGIPHRRDVAVRE